MEEWTDAYVTYKECIDKDYKNTGDNNYNYAKAKQILEETILNPNVTVDGGSLEFSFDIIIDYAMCCVFCHEPEKALRLAREVQKYLCLDNVWCNKKTTSRAYEYTEESQRKMWIKICRVYSNCKAPESVDYLIMAIETAKNEGVNLDAEFYRRIAIACGYSKKYELALRYWEQALNLADQNLKNIMQLDTRPAFWEKEKQKQALRIKYTTFWNEDGKKLEPGMIIGVYFNEIDKKVNPSLNSKLSGLGDESSGDNRKNRIEILEFVIWKIEGSSVYAFPLKVAKGRDFEFQKTVMRAGKNYILTSFLCKLPANSTVIKDVCEKLGEEEFQQLLDSKYHEIAITPPPHRLDNEYIKKFMADITRNKIIERAQIGDRIVLDDGEKTITGYYYIVGLDEESRDYIVVPVSYEYDIKADNLFRIPFDSLSIYAIISPKEEDKEQIEQKLSNIPNGYASKFCVYANREYMITGVDGDNYICACLSSDDELSNGIVKTVYLPKEQVDSYGIFDEKGLEGVIRDYLKTTNGSRTKV